jgi:hypothetical protein
VIWGFWVFFGCFLGVFWVFFWVLVLFGISFLDGFLCFSAFLVLFCAFFSVFCACAE